MQSTNKMQYSISCFLKIRYFEIRYSRLRVVRFQLKLVDI